MRSRQVKLRRAAAARTPLPPRCPWARLAVAGLCILTLTPLLAAPKDELGELHSRITALQKELDSAEESKSEAADALRQSERAISNINRRLHEISAAQRQLGQTLEQLQQQTRQEQQQLESHQALLEKLLLQRYLYGQQTPLQVLLNQQDPNQLARQLSYYAYLSRARAEAIGGLRHNLQQLDSLAHLTGQKSAELKRLQADQATNKQQLLAEQNARKSLLARISKNIRTQRKEIGRLQRDEKRLTRLVERLGRIASPLPGKRGGTLSNQQLPDVALFGIPFQQLKGRLRLPVRGELTNRFGSPREDSGALWRGLFLRAVAGEEVKAVAGGRVVFADWLRGFGNLMIIDHGGSYMSLYGNNETLFKQVGDTVRPGDTVAAVGNSGGNPESGLYFELRYQSKPFDPLQWAALR